MASLQLNLLQDGTYVFQLVGDLGVINTKRGKWKMVDDVVELGGSGVDGLRRFRVYSSAQIRGLSLLPLDDKKYRENDDEADRLFRRDAHSD